MLAVSTVENLAQTVNMIMTQSQICGQLSASLIVRWASNLKDAF